jgi:hypothetical protein
MTRILPCFIFYLSIEVNMKFISNYTCVAEGALLCIFTVVNKYFSAWILNKCVNRLSKPYDEQTSSELWLLILLGIMRWMQTSTPSAQITKTITMPSMMMIMMMIDRHFTKKTQIIREVYSQPPVIDRRPLDSMAAVTALNPWKLFKWQAVPL